LAGDTEDPPTREVGFRTSYYVRSFLDPSKENHLCCHSVFDTQTEGVIDREDNLELCIFQSYCDSDLDENGVGSSCAAQSIISTIMTQMRRWYPFAATQTTGKRDIPGMIGLSSFNMKMMMEMRQSSHLVL
jgi:hypothetical protein